MLTLLGTVRALAQVDRAQLSGTVTDPSGAVVAGVEVIAAASETGNQRDAMTNKEGIYVIPQLPVGSYTVTFSRDGFLTARYEHVEFLVGQKLTLDVQLGLGSAVAQVELRATAQLLESNSAEMAGVVGSDSIESLPVNGHNWANL